jgi:hypothetical protein
MIPVTAPSCKQAFTTLRLLFAFSRVNKCNDEVTSIATQLGPGCRGLFKRHRGAKLRQVFRQGHELGAVAVRSELRD